MPSIPTSPLRTTLCAVRLAAFSAFVVTVATVAAEAACAGDDIRSKIEAAAPGALAGIEADLAAVPNADGKLWRVTSSGGKVSHLFGTMHVSDPGTVALSPEAEAAHADASTVIIETTDMLDPAAASAAIGARPDLMFFMDGSNLLDLLPDEDEPAVERALAERGSSLVAMKAFQPWMVMAQLSIPACATANPEAGLDIALATAARDRGDRIAGLETMEEQLTAITSMPIDLQVEALVDAARLGEGVDDLYATMSALYREGEIGAIWPVLNAASELLLGEAQSAAETEAMVKLEQALVIERNYRMAERAVPYLKEGGAFVAVGALHLPGEEGLVELLRGRGFEVERAAL